MDYRPAPSVEHEVEDLVSQRIYGIALGDEARNDHQEVRDDGLRSLLQGGQATLRGDHPLAW